MRAYYIDKLRIFLTCLVVFHHTAIAFGAGGGWFYISPETMSGATQQLFSLQMGIDQSYFMSLFFFISALFMPASYDRKGFGKFIKDRLLRLGVPLLVFIFLINPTLAYFIGLHCKMQITWCGIWSQYLSPGPMWFVLTLLIFEFAYAFYRRFCGRRILTSAKFPSTAKIVAFIIFTGVVAFGIRLFYPAGKSFFGLQFGYFSLYVFMYLCGIIAGRHHWLQNISLKKSLPWFALSLVSIVLFAAASIKYEGQNGSGGLNAPSLIYAMWEPIMCVGFSYFLLAFFKKYANGQNMFALALSADSYAAYIIHPAFIVGFTFLSEQIPTTPVVRCIFVVIASIIGVFAAAHIIRKIPKVKRIL